MFTDRQTPTTPVRLLQFDKYPVHRRISLREEPARRTCVAGERPSSLSRSAVSPRDSDDREIPLVGVPDGVDGNGLIQGHQSAVVGGRERQQVRIGHLAMPEQPGMIDQFFIEQGHRTRPIHMVFCGSGASQSGDRLRRQDGAGVPGVGSVDLTVTSVNCAGNGGVRGSMTPTRPFPRAPDCRPPARPSAI